MDIFLFLNKFYVMLCIFKIINKLKYSIGLVYFFIKFSCYCDNIISFIVDCKYVGRRGVWSLG